MADKFPKVNPAPTNLQSGHLGTSLRKQRVNPRSNERGVGCGVNVDILVIRKNKILLGLLSKNWLFNNEQCYGVPGRDINFRETIGDAVIRNIKEEIDCDVKNYKIICVNANYALENHYIGVGIMATINGDVKLLRPEEWDKWEWFDKNKIPQNLFPAAKNLIECYLTNKVNIAE